MATLPNMQQPSASRSSASLLTSDFSQLSDPPPKLVDSQAFEFLSTEMLDIIAESTKVSQQKARQRRNLVEREYGLPTSSNESAVEDDDNKVDEKGVHMRLDAIGFRVGSTLCESLTRDKPGFARGRGSNKPEPLEVVKFICKDIWISLYDKQIDNLRTNHRGVFVLQDKAFRPSMRMSPSMNEESRKQMTLRTETMVCFPTGVIRGVLARFGIPNLAVGAELGPSGQVTFQIKLAPS